MRTIMSMAVRSLLPVAAAAFAAQARAGETAYDFVACGSAKLTMLEARADFTAFGLELFGIVANSTTKEFESATEHCFGTIRIHDGKRSGKGMCKWSDAAGNSFVGEWESTGNEGKWVFLSGTGRFKGVKGGGQFQYLTNAKPIVEGTSQSCRRDWGTYSIPPPPA